MPIVAFLNIKNMQLAYYFIERIEKDLSSKLRKLPKKWIVEEFSTISQRNFKSCNSNSTVSPKSRRTSVYDTERRRKRFQ